MVKTRYLNATEVWECRPDGRYFLLNTITETSRFNSITVPKSISATQHLAESQLWIARQLKNSWDMNGPYRGIYKYEIWQDWSDGRVQVS
jgi:hypothetical protein